MGIAECVALRWIEALRKGNIVSYRYTQGKPKCIGNKHRSAVHSARNQLQPAERDNRKPGFELGCHRPKGKGLCDLPNEGLSYGFNANSNLERDRDIHRD